MGIDWAAGLLSPLPLIFSAFIFTISIHLFFFSGNNFPNKNPPGLHPYPIIGHLPQFLRHRHRFLDWITDLLSASPTNTLVFHRPGGIRGVITANPSNVEHILKSHFDNYPKGPRFRSNLHDFLGRGIFNSDGPLWLLQRKTAISEFNTRSLRSFVHLSVSYQISTRLIPSLLRAADAAEPLDLQNALELFAFDNICKIAFDFDNPDPSGFAAAFRDASELSAGRFRYALPGLWKVKKLLDVGSEKRLRRSVAAVHDFAMRIIRERKKNDGTRRRGGDDLLSRFVACEEINSDEFLRDIIVSFILAGRDTTSSALAWFFWLISSRPDVERRILGEVAEVRGNGDGLGIDELRRMHYLHAAVTEAMRLYPPVPFNAADCCAGEVLPDGTEVGKGWFVAYSAYAMGRMEGIWGEDCEVFRPERWLDGGGEFRAESPFRFPAFHGGPRVCLGKEMAYIQMKSVAACVIERFELEVLLDKDVCPEHVFSLTLRMRGGLPVRVRGRRTAAIDL